MSKNIIVAIDGPAASGKSTTAKIISKRLGFIYVDSGAMYRAVTLKTLNLGANVNDEKKVAEIAANCKIEFLFKDKTQHILLDGEDVSDAIRTPNVTSKISPVAANKLVRAHLVKIQQKFKEMGNIIMDGRDIGTVVFPDADIKIFLVATPKARALRRKKEFDKKGIQVDLKKLIDDISKRDLADSSRKIGPLKKAEDAIEIDNSELSIEEQVNEIIEIIDKKFIHRFK